jgi:hypothetical protein
MTALQLLPTGAGGRAPTRTSGDRLEILTALIAAPTFDPLFRDDVIVVPGDHRVYGWFCGVPGCGRPQEPHRDHCHTHDLKWTAMRRQGKTITDFLHVAEPLQPRSWLDPPPCLICPDVPAWGKNGLCFLHWNQWAKHRRYHRGRRNPEPDFDAWLAKEKPFPRFGQCRVEPCPELADTPLGFCRRHTFRYERDGLPGGAKLPANWGRWMADCGKPIPVEYASKSRFDQWCREVGLAGRKNGKLSLLGLRPLVKAEIQWAMLRCPRFSGQCPQLQLGEFGRER